jgi:hypothetical protein
VEIKDSQFESAVTFLGIPAGDDYTVYELRSSVDKTKGTVLHVLYVSDFYKDFSWVSWSRANSEDAQSLQFFSFRSEVINCEYNRCSYSETFGAIIPDIMLKSHQDGLSVKFYGKGGHEKVLTLTSQPIREQLKVIADFQERSRAPVEPSVIPKRRSD